MLLYLTNIGTNYHRHQPRSLAMEDAAAGTSRLFLA